MSPIWRTRWQAEAAAVGLTVERLVEGVQRAAADRSPADLVTVTEVVEAVSAEHSSWGRPDVIQAICHLHRPVSQTPGLRWAAADERAADKVLELCIDLDPPIATSDDILMAVRCGSNLQRRGSPREAVLAEEERILTWATTPTPIRLDRRGPSSAPGLEVFRPRPQSRWPATTASLVVGPAGAGKTRMLAAAISDLHARRRDVFGVAPTAKAARQSENGTPGCAATPWPNCSISGSAVRPATNAPVPSPAAGRHLVVDEAGMVSTPALHQLVSLAETNRWRLVLVGDHRQLQAVGRGGLFAELCANGRVDQLEHLHRFTHDVGG